MKLRAQLLILTLYALTLAGGVALARNLSEPDRCVVSAFLTFSSIEQCGEQP